jgi:pimeloyl-ACP methyl ester carboxylesterase
MPRPKRSFAFRLVRAVFAGIAISYLLVTGAIWYTQTKILYHPSNTVYATPGDSGVPFDNITLPLKSDRLAGWWVPSDALKARTLLYLHGNAGNVAANLDQVLRLRNAGLNVFIIDYRGYGRSTGGPPRESLLHEDAERAWAYLVAERHIPPRNIVIYGHSLGGAIAVHLASNHREAGGLITEATFTSIADMAKAKRSPAAYLPLGLILTERVDSISRIGSIHLPKLIIHGDADTGIPPLMARRLYDAAPNPKQIAIIPGGGHENSAAVNATAYFAALNGFLSQYDLKPGGGAER